MSHDPSLRLVCSTLLISGLRPIREDRRHECGGLKKSPWDCLARLDVLNGWLGSLRSTLNGRAGHANKASDVRSAINSQALLNTGNAVRCSNGCPQDDLEHGFALVTRQSGSAKGC
jgi:hypothetical protein